MQSFQKIISEMPHRNLIDEEWFIRSERVPMPFRSYKGLHDAQRQFIEKIDKAGITCIVQTCSQGYVWTLSHWPSITRNGAMMGPHPDERIYDLVANPEEKRPFDRLPQREFGLVVVWTKNCLISENWWECPLVSELHVVSGR